MKRAPVLARASEGAPAVARPPEVAPVLARASEGAPRQSAAGRTRRVVVAQRGTVAAAVVLAFVGLALRGDAQQASARLDDQVVPLLTAHVPCRLSGGEAVAHAASLEQLATARWARVPFALREAPRAALQMAEAEACYAAANERVGRQRSAAARRAYGAEMQRRFARARLLLRTHLARSRAEEARGAPFGSRFARAGAPLASALGRAAARSDAQLQVATLLALLERAPPSAEPYRRELARLARRYAVEASEHLGPEEDPR